MLIPIQVSICLLAGMIGAICTARFFGLRFSKRSAEIIAVALVGFLSGAWVSTTLEISNQASAAKAFLAAVSAFASFPALFLLVWFALLCVRSCCRGKARRLARTATLQMIGAVAQSRSASAMLASLANSPMANGIYRTVVFEAVEADIFAEPEVVSCDIVGCELTSSFVGDNGWVAHFCGKDEETVFYCPEHAAHAAECETCATFWQPPDSIDEDRGSLGQE